jgi:hypothetical protein
MKNPKLLLWILLGLLGLFAILVVVLIINSRQGRPAEEPEKRAGKEDKQLAPDEHTGGRLQKAPAAGEAAVLKPQPTKPQKSAPARPKAEPPKGAVEPTSGPSLKPGAPSRGGAARGPTGDPHIDFGIEAVKEPASPEAKPPDGPAASTTPDKQQE